MSAESPEEVLQYIFAHIHEKPNQPNSELRHSTEHKQQLQAWSGGRLALDFDPTETFNLTDEVADGEIQIRPAVVINDDAYTYMGNCLLALVREADGLWKLRIALSMCWGCFGDHSFSSGHCWNVLCECCGGTGWEGGDLEFCAAHPLPIDPSSLIPHSSPRTVFLHLLEKRILVLQILETIEQVDVSPAMVRGDTAKIVVNTPVPQYMALMNKISNEQWHLSAFLPLCSVCGGHGLLDTYLPCPACGGLKWGQTGELRYCRNNAEGWWEWQE